MGFHIMFYYDDLKKDAFSFKTLPLHIERLLTDLKREQVTIVFWEEK